MAGGEDTRSKYFADIETASDRHRERAFDYEKLAIDYTTSTFRTLTYLYGGALVALPAAIRTATAGIARDLPSCLSAMLSPCPHVGPKASWIPVKLASPDSASPFTLPGNQAPIDTTKPVELSLRGAEVGRESLRQPRRRPDEKGSENRIVKQRASG